MKTSDKLRLIAAGILLFVSLPCAIALALGFGQ